MTLNIDEKKLAVIKHSTLSLVRFFDNISVAIIITNSKQEPIDIASGTCIKIGDRYFIATAAHCVKKQTKENIFLIHTKTPNLKDVEISDYGFTQHVEYDLDISDIIQYKDIKLQVITANDTSITFVPINDKPKPTGQD